MTADPWVYVVLGAISYQIIKMAYLVLDQTLRERRQRRAIRALRAIYPDAQYVYTAIDSSDRKAMAKLKEQIESADYVHYVKTDHTGYVRIEDEDQDRPRDR